jgi:hypothetical protein
MIGIQIRSEFRELIDPRALFTDEHKILDQLEQLSGEGLAWDDARYDTEPYPYVSQIYLLDESQAERTLEAVAQLPVITAAQRREALEECQIS